MLQLKINDKIKWILRKGLSDNSIKILDSVIIKWKCFSREVTHERKIKMIEKVCNMKRILTNICSRYVKAYFCQAILIEKQMILKIRDILYVNSNIKKTKVFINWKNIKITDKKLINIMKHKRKDNSLINALWYWKKFTLFKINTKKAMEIAQIRKKSNIFNIIKRNARIKNNTKKVMEIAQIRKKRNIFNIIKRNARVKNINQNKSRFITEDIKVYELVLLFAIIIIAYFGYYFTT